MSSDNPPQKHHYIPKCYLKAWTSKDKLIEYRRRPGKISIKPVTPEYTGFEDNLYTIYDVPPDLQYALETRFFRIVDQEGNNALEVYRTAGAAPSIQNRFAIARFILCIIHRNPEHLHYMLGKWDQMFSDVDTTIRENYARLRRATDPKTYEEARETFNPAARGRGLLSLIMKVSESENVLEFLANMVWLVVDDPTQSLITSDRPIAFLPRDQAGNDVAFALSPERLLLLTRDPTKMNPNLACSSRRLFRTYNKVVCLQAATYVYAADGSNFALVERHLGFGTTQFIGDVDGPEMLSARLRLV